MSRFAVAVSLFVLLSAATASSQTLLIPADDREAFLGQASPSVASNGDDFLAVWQDFRRGSSAAPGIAAARLDAAGLPTTPYGFPIADSQVSNAAPKVIYGSEGYLVAWLEMKGNHALLRAERFDRNAMRLGDVVTLWNNASMYGPVHVAYRNGEFLVVVGTSGYPTATAIVVNERSGQSQSYTIPGALAVTADRDGWLLFDRRCNPCLNAATVDVTSFRFIDSQPTPPQVVEAIADGGSLRASSDGESALLAISAEHELRVRDPRTGRLTASIAVENLTAFELQWTGSCHLLAFAVQEDGQSIVRVVRLSRSGELLDHTPLVLDEQPFRRAQISIAASQSSTLLVADRSMDSRTYFPYDGATVDAMRLERCGNEVRSSILLPRSATPRDWPAITATNVGYFAAWIEYGANRTDLALHAAHLSIDGKLVTPNRVIAPAVGWRIRPAVASNGRDALVAWQGQGGLSAKLVAADGTIGETLLLASGGTAMRPAAVWNGHEFLVVYERDEVLHAVSVSASGVVSSTLPFDLGRGNSDPTLIWTGTDYLLVSAYLQPGCRTLCMFTGPNEAYVRRVSREGTITAERKFAREEVFAPPLAAWNGNDLLIAADTINIARDGSATQLRLVARDLSDLWRRDIEPSGSQALWWSGESFHLVDTKTEQQQFVTQKREISTAGVVAPPKVIDQLPAFNYGDLASVVPVIAVARRPSGSGILLMAKPSAWSTAGGVGSLYVFPLGVSSPPRRRPVRGGR
jgi:hypothetical protein